MNINLSKSPASLGKFLLFTSLFVACTASFAAVGGGMAKVQSTAEEIKTGLYGLLGILSLIYLMYLGLMAFTEKKSWSDFGWGIVHVAAVGGSVALGSWAWSLFL